MPVHWHYTLASRFDHHAFEPLLCWLLLWSLARGATSRRPVGWIVMGACSIWLGLALWPGVLLHLVLLVLVLLVGLWHLSAAPALARTGAWVFGLALPLALPLVTLSPWSTRFVFFASSALHLVCLATVATICALAGWPVSVTRRIPHAMRLLALTGLGVLMFIIVPPLRRAVVTGLEYTLQGSMAAFSDEAHSLLQTSPVHLVGWAPLVCTGTCAALLLLRRRRAVAHDPFLFLVALATVILALPAVVQQRWLVAWSPFGAAAVGATWCLGWAHARPTMRHRVAALVALAGLLTPAVLDALSPPVRYAEQRAGESFLRRIRALTPPAAADEYSATARPTYGVLTSWSIGHLFTYLAGRPALANNFWGLPSHDAANRLALRLYLSQDCEVVAREMARRRLRYVLINPVDPRKMLLHANRAGLPNLGSLLDQRQRLQPEAATLFVLRLGIRDGESFVLPGQSRRIVPACGRFALMAEALLRAGAPRDEGGDFKLYQRVVGARARIDCRPGSPVQASLPLRTERGRRLAWSSVAVCGENGLVTLRLPYPTDGSWGPVRVAAAHYAVQVGDARIPLAVSAAAVQGGQTLRATPGGSETAPGRAVPSAKSSTSAAEVPARR